ncbi:MAG: hypothetical protein A2848_00060 [Candidatus Magasanikbacteria bacterium RIFCSPHIGHO2_01_FULL_50_8]|uniref:Uncharacterized protein n=1 Tax=Candidatus Magasanikbacteria bacterium RIFCSPHIGHO2_01_FULL_50_8 TaxID=1798674 RepID=A0A1F6LNR2_9BACT|nr:MAG: hypothetical protein A2848_00060 [Candidatus Magasanikbacteria bacterium RIFCSPHIGHO2_01_FULL_50_8]
MLWLPHSRHQPAAKRNVMQKSKPLGSFGNPIFELKLQTVGEEIRVEALPRTVEETPSLRDMTVSQHAGVPRLRVRRMEYPCSGFVTVYVDLDDWNRSYQGSYYSLEQIVAQAIKINKGRTLHEVNAYLVTEAFHRAKRKIQHGRRESYSVRTVVVFYRIETESVTTIAEAARGLQKCGLTKKRS